MSRYLIQRALCHPALPVSQKALRAAQRVELSPDQEAFYERLGEDADVRLEPGINQDEVFDDQFERRAHEIQRTPPSSSSVSVISPKTGPWTANNNLGIERAFAPDANNRQTILKLPEWGFPEIWTLCLGINDYSTGNDPFPISFSITAELEFGGGGAIQTASIDWLQGMSVSLPMNALNLVASYRTGSGEGATSIPADLRLRATLVRGRALRPRPTLTVFFDGEDTIEIPKFAQAVTILPAFSLPGTTPFAFYTNGGYVQLLSSGSGGPGDVTYSNSQLTRYIDFANNFVGAPTPIPIGPFQRLLVMADAAGAPDPNHGAVCAQFDIAL